MKVIVPGHVYELEGVGGYPPQRVVFVQNRGDKYPGNEGEPRFRPASWLPPIAHRNYRFLADYTTAPVPQQMYKLMTDSAGKVQFFRQRIGIFRENEAAVRTYHHRGILSRKPLDNHCLARLPSLP